MPSRGPLAGGATVENGLESFARARRLPSLDGLRAFEVAARHLSFTDAAQELFVTQGAVSQRIKALEHELGFALFDRRVRGLALTVRGERLARGIRLGVGQIAEALAALDDVVSAGPLVLSVLPSFAGRWLIPRLAHLTEREPHIHVQVVADRRLADLSDRRTHAAIRFGPSPPPDLAATTLMGDTIAPVWAPELLARYGEVTRVAELARLPILHDSSVEGDPSGTDWASWLNHIGAPDVRLPTGQRFSEPSLALEAAASGLGVALARASLIGADLAARRLVRLALPVVPSAYRYYLLCLPEMGDEPRLARLRDWLLAEIAADDGKWTGPLPDPRAGVLAAS
ncbi:MAG TPA: LysR substrate-binding domain-containing protein [Acetobacteraceae bacterium]